jgi:hypothetical protein
MPEMDQPAPTRRRFRFGLRTLLVVVTLAAASRSLNRAEVASRRLD